MILLYYFRVIFSDGSSVIATFFFFSNFSKTAAENRRRIRHLRAPSLLDSGGLLSLLLLPTPRQAGKGLFCLVCIALVVVAVRFGLWTMMAELLCFSVDDFIVLSCSLSNSSSEIASYLFPFSNVSKTAAETATELDTCGHRRCWTQAAWCTY